MPKINFTIRIYQDEVRNPTLSSIQELTISGITLLSKPEKFGGICTHRGNQRKFKYKIKITRSFRKVSGSHSTPTLSFGGKYVDIIIKDFPRYPAFGQCKYVARNVLNGYPEDRLFNGFPLYLQYRKIEILINK